MALILEANYSKKIGLPNYSSHQFAVTLRTELPDIAKVDAESARLYRLLQDAVDREMKSVGFLPGTDTQPEPRAIPLNGNGNGNGHNDHDDVWKCTDKQRELILKIVAEHHLDKNAIEALAMDRFNTPVKALNNLQSSGLIDELLQKHGKGTRRGQKAGTR